MLSITLLIETLKLEILKLRRMQFGHKSEKREHQIEQLELWVEELESAQAQRTDAAIEGAQTPSTNGNRKPRRTFPAHLPREERIIAPTQTACPDCGGALKHLGEDVCELLDLEPIRFKVIREVRSKLACARCPRR